jgi:radical SAM modification target selenobiotic family peptide
MDTRDIKKYLSGLCIAGLLAGASLTLIGCPQKGGGGEEGQPGTSGTQEQQQQQPSSS